MSHLMMLHLTNQLIVQLENLTFGMFLLNKMVLSKMVLNKMVLFVCDIEILPNFVGKFNF